MNETLQHQLNHRSIRKFKDTPLSDEQLAQMLKAGGIAVARRTVAKYREALGIPSSNLRRQHI